MTAGPGSPADRPGAHPCPDVAHPSAARPGIAYFSRRLRMCEFLATFAATYLTTIVLLRLTDLLDAVISHIRGKNDD
jgi:hypothetical protein